MRDEDGKLCKSIENALSALGPLPGPFDEKKSLSEFLNQTRISWSPIEKSDLLPTAQKLEKLLRQRWHHNTEVVDTPEFTMHLRERIATGELTLSRVSTPDNSFLRYQRWSDVR
jgi:hypothetical protein